MLGDVLTACVATGRTLLVTDDADARALADELGAEIVDDPGGGQGRAVAAALERVEDGPVVVLNADIPCVVPHDIRTLAGAAELGRVGLVEAGDGTTNALALPRASLFAPLYGAGSADRFRDHAAALGVSAVAAVIPNLADDVDTLEDLSRIGLRAGPRTQAAIGGLLGAVKVALLSGGVGGARFARGLVSAVDPAGVTVIGNVGDDLDVLGLAVSPDLDSILYALAGLHDEERGWGRSGETWEALATVSALGGEDWFRLGDRDLGLHLVRTQALRSGEPLSTVTARLARALGIEATIVPATDDRLRTWIDTPAGSFPFQEWFVARGHRDEVDARALRGRGTAPGSGRARGSGGGGRDRDRALPTRT